MITFSDFKLEGTVKIKTATREKYPNRAVITKLEVTEGQRSASIHFNTKAQELLGVEIPTQVVIIKHGDTFLISPFDKVKEVNPNLAMAFESKKLVYRLGMNGKVSSKSIHAELTENEYLLVVENAEEGIFKMEPIIDYTANTQSDAQSIVTTPTNVVVEEESILETVNNVEAYDEF